MVKKELIERSPLRILEKSIHGGIEKGSIGVIAARKGVGKTACLVHIALDQIFQGNHVIHISFTEKTQHIISWYEDLFQEIAQYNNLENALQEYEDIGKHRVIMNFMQDGIHITEIEKSIRSLIKDGHFEADTLIIDGYDFGISSKEELREFKQFAEELGLSLWFSVSLTDGPAFFDGSSVPPVLSSLVDEIDVIICLQPQEKHIRLNLVKDHNAPVVDNLHLRLDPKVLLIASEE